MRVAVDLDPHDLAVAQREDHSPFNCVAAPLPAPMTPLAVHGDHLIPVVDQLVEYDLRLLLKGNAPNQSSSKNALTSSWPR